MVGPSHSRRQSVRRSLGCGREDAGGARAPSPVGGTEDEFGRLVCKVEISADGGARPRWSVTLLINLSIPFQTRPTRAATPGPASPQSGIICPRRAPGQPLASGRGVAFELAHQCPVAAIGPTCLPVPAALSQGADQVPMRSAVEAINLEHSVREVNGSTVVAAVCGGHRKDAKCAHVGRAGTFAELAPRTRRRPRARTRRSGWSRPLPSSGR